MMKIKKYINCVTSIMLLLTIMTNVFAKVNGVVHDNYTIDVFKTSSITADQVDREYGVQFDDIAKKMLMMNSMKEHVNGLDAPVNIIMDGLRKKGEFLYLGMSPIVYPGNKRIGISIDVVDKRDANRLQGFRKAPIGSYREPRSLFESWYEYEKVAMALAFKGDMLLLMKDCPAYHCLFGFNDPSLKKYAEIFNTEVPKYKTVLADILKDDKDENKRATAAYLLAHLKNGNEVIDLLTPSMRDPSSGVRNNAMRVLLQAVQKVNDVEFPVEEAIHALSYPTTTDRNKDLYLLSSLAEKPRYRQYIKDHACHALLEQYHLVQLNLHSGAYSALKNISGKDYAMDDVAAWESWVAKNCPAPDMV